MMTDPMLVALITSIGTMGASSGLWALIQKKATRNTAQSRLLKGLAYDKIITVGMAYIQRGWISKDEYEDYLTMLVEPYREMGGNGVADRIATEVGTLPFRTVPFSEIVIKDEKDR